MGLAHIPTSNRLPPVPRGGRLVGGQDDPGDRPPARGLDRVPDLPHEREARARRPRATRASPRASASTATRSPRRARRSRRHTRTSNKPCLDCHGSVAHLPTSMVGRDQDECWLCHKPNPSPPPIKPHPDPQDLTCRDCHQSARRWARCRSTTPCAATTPACCATTSAAGRVPRPEPSATPAPTASSSADPLAARADRADQRRRDCSGAYRMMGHAGLARSDLGGPRRARRRARRPGGARPRPRARDHARRPRAGWDARVPPRPARDPGGGRGVLPVRGRHASRASRARTSRMRSCSSGRRVLVVDEVWETGETMTRGAGAGPCRRRRRRCPRCSTTSPVARAWQVGPTTSRPLSRGG